MTAASFAILASPDKLKRIPALRVYLDGRKMLGLEINADLNWFIHCPWVNPFVVWHIC